MDAKQAAALKDLIADARKGFGSDSPSNRESNRAALLRAVQPEIDFLAEDEPDTATRILDVITAALADDQFVDRAGLYLKKGAFSVGGTINSIDRILRAR